MFFCPDTRPDIAPVPFIAKTRQEKKTNIKKKKPGRRAGTNMHRDINMERKMNQKKTKPLPLKCTIGLRLPLPVVPSHLCTHTLYIAQPTVYNCPTSALSCKTHPCTTPGGR